ncbi:hypothetical protein SESBI_40210 [Sesbania bispinosa]|nr:hypothetical protein SESBI_40210 [Sesbania bispinosa]
MDSPMPTTNSSPVPTPMASTVPTPMASPEHTPVPSPVHTLVPSPVTDFSDDYESVDDSAYRPSPYVSEGDEVEAGAVNICGKRRMGTSTIDKGKGVAVSGSRKTGKNMGTSATILEENSEGDDISEEEEKSKNWVPPPTDDQQTGQDEVDLSQGVPTSDPPQSQPSNDQASNMENSAGSTTHQVQQPTIPSSTVENPATQVALISATSDTIMGTTNVRPATKGNNFKNPPYRPPGLVPGSLRHKMATMRPPSASFIVPPMPAHNNSPRPQLSLQPSADTIQAASQGTRERFMKFIPTPRGPSPGGHAARGPSPAGPTPRGHTPARPTPRGPSPKGPQPPK